MMGFSGSSFLSKQTSEPLLQVYGDSPYERSCVGALTKLLALDTLHGLSGLPNHIRHGIRYVGSSRIPSIDRLRGGRGTETLPLGLVG